jgi:two-component system sensor histidine kinase MprB
MSWHLSLHARLALLSAIAVAIAIAAVSSLAWYATARSLRAQVDRALTSSPLSQISNTRLGDNTFPQLNPEDLCSPPPTSAIQLQSVVGSLQLVRSDGSTCAATANSLVPVTAADTAVAVDQIGGKLRSATTTSGAHVRVITLPFRDGYALMLYRDLAETDNTLSALALALIVASGLGTLGALTAGLIVARTGLRPVGDLTRAAEQIAATEQLDVQISVAGSDEVARLAMAFNGMTTALSAARQRQQQLIADASHELRTPLTSLRTNVELLLRSEEAARALPSADRRDLLLSLSAQLNELTELTSELSLLAQDEPATELVPVRMDEVVERAVQRASLRGDHEFVHDLHPWTLTGDPTALERAVLNLLDNAVKFSPSGSTVQVYLRDGLLQVVDDGPGIPAAERQRVFERFWRAPAARSMPGSGLGLAIVADVARKHSGEVWAANSATGRGAVMSMRLPGAP